MMELMLDLRLLRWDLDVVVGLLASVCLVEQVEAAALQWLWLRQLRWGLLLWLL